MSITCQEINMFRSGKAVGKKMQHLIKMWEFRFAISDISLNFPAFIFYPAPADPRYAAHSKSPLCSIWILSNISSATFPLKWHFQHKLLPCWKTGMCFISTWQMLIPTPVLPVRTICAILQWWHVLFWKGNKKEQKRFTFRQRVRRTSASLSGHVLTAATHSGQLPWGLELKLLSQVANRRSESSSWLCCFFLLTHLLVLFSWFPHTSDF